MHDIVRCLYVPYSFDSWLTLPLASRTRLGVTAILAKFLEKKLSFQATTFWYALKCVEP